LKTVNW